MAEFADLHFGSEEVYDHICATCEEENLVRKAEGYCKDCPEFLCSICIHYHKSVRVTRSHVIIDVTDDMDSVIGQFANATIQDDVCLDHGKSTIDKYCKDHDEVGCDMCITLSHNKCDTQSISLCLGIYNDAKLGSTVADLNGIVAGFNRAKDDKERNEIDAIKEYKAFLGREKQQRKHIQEQIRTSQMLDEKEKVTQLNLFLKNVKLNKKIMEDSLKVASTLLQQSDEAYRSCNDSKKFITCNKLCKQVSLLRKTLGDADVKDNSIHEGSMEAQQFRLYKEQISSVSGLLASPTLRLGLRLPFPEVILDPLQGQDTIVKNGVTTNITTRHNCLTAMKQYKKESLEELRYKWYQDLQMQNPDLSKSGIFLPVKDTILPASTETSHKMLLLGDWGTGKTTFMRRHISGDINKTYKESMGVYAHPITLWTTGGQVSFDVWDTCGQERFGPLRDGFYKDAKCAIVMFDVSSSTSVDSVSRWYKLLTDQCGYLPVVVCGNRVDKATVTVKNGNLDKLRKLQISCLKYLLISGKTMTNFETPFLTIAQALTSDYTMNLQSKCSLYPPGPSGVDVKVPKTKVTKTTSDNDNHDTECSDSSDDDL